jgi:predicted CopG family antitoxin
VTWAPHGEIAAGANYTSTMQALPDHNIGHASTAYAAPSPRLGVRSIFRADSFDRPFGPFLRLDRNTGKSTLFTMPTINLRSDVYRKLRRLKWGKSFSVAIDELIETRATTDENEILAGLKNWSGRRILSSRVSAVNKRVD